MTVRIYQGTTLLADQGFLHQGRAYVPGDALTSYTGRWRENTVFINSPLAGKTICVAVLNHSGGNADIPPEIEDFLSLCKSAGASLRFYDGGGYPGGNIFIAIELGLSQPSVKYLGAPFSSKALARKIASCLKGGLNLPYLADPVAFKKPRYNLRFKLWNRLFTPALAIEWPAHLDLGPWLFAGLMEHNGGGLLDPSPLIRERRLQTATAGEEQRTLPSPELPLAQPEPVAAPPPEPVRPQPPPQAASEPPPTASQQEQPPAAIKPEPDKPRRRSATMSPASYPDLYSQSGKKTLSKEPFC